MSTRLPLRIMLLAPAPSEGRGAMALRVAQALAVAGCEVCLIAPTEPAGFAAVAAGLPGLLRWHATARALAEPVVEAPDWLIALPGPAPAPALHSLCEHLLLRQPARLALFCPPLPKAPDGGWEALRRLGWQADLLVTAGASQHALARPLFAGAPPRLETWTPAIDSLEAAPWLDEPGDGSLLVPVPRGSFEPVADFLATLPAGLRSGHRLRLLPEEDIPPGRIQALAERLAPDGGGLEALPMPAATARFAWLARASALLLPPPSMPVAEDFLWPLEAAYAGLPVIAPPQPLWRDWLGGEAFRAASAAPADMADALARALAAPAARPARQEAGRRFGLEEAGARLLDLLLRAMEGAAPRRRRPTGEVGITVIEGGAVPLPAPPALRSAWRGGHGEILLTLRLWVPAGQGEPSARDEAGAALPLLWLPRREEGGAVEGLCHLILPAGGTARLRLPGETGGTFGLACRKPLENDRWRPARCAVETDAATPEGRLVEGWVLAGQRLRGVLFSPDGIRWVPAALHARPEILRRHPGYPAGPCGFRLRLPPAPAPDAGAARLLCLDGEGNAVELLRGWPPHAAERAA